MNLRVLTDVIDDKPLADEAIDALIIVAVAKSDLTHLPIALEMILSKVSETSGIHGLIVDIVASSRSSDNIDECIHYYRKSNSFLLS
jgi:hypothetical protein